MRILAIDPGTRCGYAYCEDNVPHVETSGVWDLTPKRFDSGGMRFINLLQALADVRADFVVYEEVRRHKGADAAFVYGGLVSHIQSHCEHRGIPYTAIPVGTIKKHATGKGNANKEAMLEAAQARWGDQVVSSDQADALWILDCYLAQMGNGS